MVAQQKNWLKNNLVEAVERQCVGGGEEGSVWGVVMMCSSLYFLLKSIDYTKWYYVVLLY